MRRRVMGPVAGVLLVCAVTAGMALAQDAVPEEIARIVHEWSDGGLTAEEALEQVDALVHDADGTSNLVMEIDAIVHDSLDGALSAEEALRLIDTALQATSEDEPPGDDQAGDGTDVPEENDGDAAPAQTGNAGLMAAGAEGISLLVLGSIAAALIGIGGARAATGRFGR